MTQQVQTSIRRKAFLSTIYPETWSAPWATLEITTGPFVNAPPPMCTLHVPNVAHLKFTRARTKRPIEITQLAKGNWSSWLAFSPYGMPQTCSVKGSSIFDCPLCKPGLEEGYFQEISRRERVKWGDRISRNYLVRGHISPE